MILQLLATCPSPNRRADGGLDRRARKILDRWEVRFRCRAPRDALPTREFASAVASGSIKRARILEAATRVFASRGYHGARVSDIAREAGIAYGLVYHYFATRKRSRHDLRRSAGVRSSNLVDGISAGRSRVGEVRQLAAIVLFAYRGGRTG